MLSHFSHVWLCNPICSPPGSSFHGIFQTRILEWVAISFSRRSSRPRDWTHVSYVSCIGRQVLYYLAPPGKIIPTQFWDGKWENCISWYSNEKSRGKGLKLYCYESLVLQSLGKKEIDTGPLVINTPWGFPLDPIETPHEPMSLKCFHP